MSKVKWRTREFTPTENMPGRTHSIYAEAVISNEIDNRDLASKIAARTGFKPYEAQAMVSAVADIVAEEVLESNRITLCDSNGTKMVSIYPKVSGSINDDEVLEKTTAAHALNPKEEIRSVAEESDLTADRLTWTLGATIGIKFSKIFAFNKQAQKVGYVATDTVIPSDDEPGGGGDTPTPSGSVAAPTISGTTPFETNTSVTMSGPTGAEIRYTTDGSTPTSSSSLYSSAITLSATTTVKAIAIKDGQTSEVTTKTFTKSGGGGDAD